LIVSAAILVVGVFLPLVVRIRGYAQRIDCANNLKQIALAIQNYVDTDGKFPPGTHPAKDLPIEKRLSWMVEIAPFVENDHISWWSHHSESWDSPGNRFLLEDHTVFLCPSGPRMRDGYTSGLTHYVGIAGVGTDAATYPLEDDRIGIFGYDRQVTIKDVKDGLGNTMIIMETSRENGPWAAGGPSTLRGVDPDDEPYFGKGRQFGGMHLRSASVFEKRSWITNCAMCDASVRGVRIDADPNIIKAAATIAGGELFGCDW
jgi:uncharacterized protein DUF1559